MSKLEAARRFADLWKEEREIEKRRRKIGARLMRILKRSGATFVEVGKEKVQLVVTAHKRPSKGDVASWFGPVTTDRFWLNLKADVSEYLTVVKA